MTRYYLFSRSSITTICLMLISSISFTWVFGGLWLTYAGCQIVVIWQESGVSNCTLIVTMSVQCGYLTRSLFVKVLTVLQNGILLFCSCILLICMCFSTCPLPLCIHGNRCPMGQLQAGEQCFHILLIMIIAKHIF